jgi:hypothetical protein
VVKFINMANVKGFFGHRCRGFLELGFGFNISQVSEDGLRFAGVTE